MQAHEANVPGLLARLGFDAEGDGEYTARVHDDVDKARLFAALRDAGVLFERGREWSPAEVFEYLRDQGLVAGPFRSIAWQGPAVWVSRDE